MKSISNKCVGERIRLIRQEKGWSLEVLANRLEISVPALSKIETALTDINVSRLEQIANVFQIPMANLINGPINNPVQENYPFNKIQKDITDREHQIFDLQRRLIYLYEELRSVQSIA